ncbi:ribosome biogenesis GTPase Der [Chitinophagales bacterium]|nr:ribosome biogenesis GTPase Der [Chitinophagales bacterium]
MSFTVAIVGRPNVGKSTFFNRMVGGREAIVDDFSGVTRDRQYGESDWNGKEFNIIDTGGFVQHSDEVFEKAIREQVHIAIEEASIIIFMVDVTTGITDLDDDVANLLRRGKTPVLLAVNKVDNHRRMLEANEFWGMGFKETFFVSSISGGGTGDILDALVKHIPDNVVTDDLDLPKITIIGQPNVGKSSLLNALVGEDRNIVTNVAGTTRDSIHTRYNMYNMDFLLVDTAGVRKKAKVMDNIEFYSVIRAFKAVEDSDVCLLMIDAQAGIEAQDLALFGLIQRKHKGVVILVNKWDLVEKETNTARDMEKRIKEKLAPFNDVPILFISALEKNRVHKALEHAMAVFKRRKTKIATSKLNEFLAEALEAHNPPSVRGAHVRINYATQLPIAYPAFAFFTNYPLSIKKPYKNYLENRLREQFDFTGVPMMLFFRKK